MLHEEKENKESLPIEKQTFLSGLIRNVLKSVSYLTRIESIGRLPLTLPIKIIGNSATTLTQINEIIETIKSSYSEIKEKKIKSSFNSIFHITLKSYLNFFKSGILGGILFQIYEDTLIQLSLSSSLSTSTSNSLISSIFVTIFPCNSSSTSSNSSSSSSQASNRHTLLEFNQSNEFNKLVLYSSFLSLSSGLISGGVHGTLSTTWDYSLFILLKYFKFSTYIKQEITYHIPNKNSINFIGTTISHSLIHGSLFGTYEFIKRLSLYLIGLTHQSHHLTLIEGGFSIFLGGFICSIVSDTISVVTNSLQENGIIKTIKIFKFKELEFKYSMRSTIPTILGFYAYEYTKDSFALESEK